MRLTQNQRTDIKNIVDILSSSDVAETIPLIVVTYLSNTSPQKPLDKLPSNVSTMLSQILSESI